MIEQVVEVVGDAAGEAAEGLHLLRLTELLFEVPALRHVHGHGQETVVVPRIVERRGRRDEDPDARELVAAVDAPEPDVGRREDCGAVLLEVARPRGVRVGVDEIDGSHADQGLSVRAHHGGHAAVHEAGAALRVDRPHALVGGLDDASIALSLARAPSSLAARLSGFQVWSRAPPRG